MYITEIEITDLRCFNGTHHLSLDRGDGTYAGWTVFAGRNGTGKTTLLRALGLASVGLVRATVLNRGEKWTRPDKQFADVRVTVSDNKRKVDQSISFEGVPERDSKLHQINRVFRWKEDENDFEGLQSHVIPSEFVLVGYSALRLGWTPADQSPDPVIARVEHLILGGGKIEEAVRWLQSIHLRELEGRPGYKEVKRDVLRILNDGLLPDATVLRVDSDGLWVKRAGVEVPLQRISDGYQAVVPMVLDLIRRLSEHYVDLSSPLSDNHVGLSLPKDGDAICLLPGVVLIDEVDAHMHVSWQQKIGFWLKNHFPKVQFLVTTHSPFVCQAASPHGLIRLPSPGETRKMGPVADWVFKAVVNGSVDDAVMSELFGLDHAHSDQSERDRDKIAMLETKLLRKTATEEDVGEYERLKAQFPDGLEEEAERRVRALHHRLAGA